MPSYLFVGLREPALSLGVAFQLTNILRDVGEDAVQRGRVYLLREDLQKFGVSEQHIHGQRLDENYRAMMKFQIGRARMNYELARLIANSMNQRSNDYSLIANSMN